MTVAQRREIERLARLARLARRRGDAAGYRAAERAFVDAVGRLHRGSR